MAAVGARQPHVLADRDRHRPARAAQLGGQLDARRRGAHHEYAPVGELVGVAVVERGQLLDVVRQGGTQHRHRRPVAGTARDHHGPAADLTLVGGHVVAVVSTAHRRDHDSGADGRLRLLGEALDQPDDLGHRQVAVRVRPVVRQPGQVALPVGREQPQRVPTLVAPRVRHLAALEHDVVDRPLREEVARGQPGVAGPDDNSAEDLRQPRRSRPWGWSTRRRPQTASGTGRRAPRCPRARRPRRS